MKERFFLGLLLLVFKTYAQTLYVLGTLQDGGAPHMNCEKECCALSKENDFVASLGVIDTKQTYFFDASPDFVAQSRYLHQFSENTTLGIFLTHAHMGHYTGLMHLGREAANTKEVSVYAMPRMADFLRTNGPWSQLVTLKNIVLHELLAEKTLTLSSRLRVTPLLVPHRDEFSETVGYWIQGARKSALYIPDIDKWSLWEKDIVSMIKKVDYALLDATFFEDGELPRPMREVPHPFVEESAALFETLDPVDREKIYFIHLNHSNPARDSNFQGRQELEAKGFHFAHFGMRLEL